MNLVLEILIAFLSSAAVGLMLFAPAFVGALSFFYLDSVYRKIAGRFKLEKRLKKKDKTTAWVEGVAFKLAVFFILLAIISTATNLFIAGSFYLNKVVIVKPQWEELGYEEDYISPGGTVLNPVERVGLFIALTLGVAFFSALVSLAYLIVATILSFLAKYFKPLGWPREKTILTLVLGTILALPVIAISIALSMGYAYLISGVATGVIPYG